MSVSVLKVPILRMVVVGLGLYFLVIASALMLMPQLMAEQFNISPGEQGLSTIRGDLGGLFLGLAIMSFVGLRLPIMLVAVAILLGAIAFGRVLGFFFDGVTPFTIMLCLAEAFLAVLFATAATRLRAARKTTDLSAKSTSNETTGTQQAGDENELEI